MSTRTRIATPRRPRLAGAVVAAVATLLAAGAPALRAENFAVGPGCTYTTIASAVLAAWLTSGDDVIKITADLTNQSPILDDFKPSVRGKVTIRGGYTSCDDTSASGRSVVDGVTSQPVFRVQTSSQSESRVILENLEIRGGARGAAVTGGGHLTLNNVLVTDNEGGGVAVTDGTLVTNGSTTIEVNGWSGPIVPPTGGGIDCFGGNLDLAGRVENNHAELGAGLAMLSGCLGELRPGFVLYANNATSNGGGIYLSGPSVLIGNGNGNAISIHSNLATRGGGLYATGAGAVVALQDSQVLDNIAELAGGGVYALTGPQISLLRGVGCSTGSRCNTLEGNSLTNEGEGSAVYAWNAFVQLRQQRVDDHQAVFQSTNQPSLLYVRGNDGELWLENLAIWNNRATELIWAVDGASVIGGYLSTARNSYGATVGLASSYVLVTSASASFYSSIFWDHQGFFLGGSSPALANDCLIVSSTTGVPIGSSFISTANPQFLDADGGNLHLPSSSPAVDYCDEFAYPWPGAPDFDGQTRNVDYPTNPNGSPGVGGGRYDIGFDEVQTGAPSWIFSDDFESGNVSNWSSHHP